MKKPEKIEIAQSDVDILKLMIKYYEERGGGYSQQETLKLAIRTLKACTDWEKYHDALLKEIEGKLPQCKGCSGFSPYQEGHTDGFNAYRTEALKILREILGGGR